MANFYTDVPEIRFEMENSPLMQRIVDLKERDYADKDKYDEAPQDYEDALDNYHRVLDIVGDITANTIAPNATKVELHIHTDALHHVITLQITGTHKGVIISEPRPAHH